MAVYGQTFHNVPYVFPTPDPVKQDSLLGAVLPMDQQDHIKLRTYTAIGATEMGKG